MNKTTLNKAVNEFPNYLYILGKSSATKDAYMADLAIFKKYMNDNFPSTVYVDKIKRSELLSYQKYLMDKVNSKEYKRTTVERKFDSLKVFFSYLKENDFTIENILKDFTFARTKGKFSKEFCESYLPNYLKTDELRIIIDTAKKSKSKNTYRDVAILELLRCTGCRRSTVLELEWSDIDFFDKTIILTHEKTKNELPVPIPEQLLNALTDYAMTLKVKTGKVFTSNKSTSLSKTAFNDIIRKYIGKSGLKEKKDFNITSRTFRHSFITDLVKKDVPLDKISSFTGHKDINTLQVYTHLKTDDLKSVASLIA